MHVLFVHPNFPAQFGHVAMYLIEKHGWSCTFATTQRSDQKGPIRIVQYQPKSGATKSTHFCSRTFENQVWQSHALFETLAGRDDLRPDLVVGHTGFVSTLYLRELYDCPAIGYFEYFYGSRLDARFRQDLPSHNLLFRLRARTRNASLLLDLENCDAGYSPTRFQRSRLPAAYRPKIATVFDGIDVETWKPVEQQTRSIAGQQIPPDCKVITYVSRGLESMRGFDLFMKLAKRICDQRSDVVFLIAGEDRVAYGGDLSFTGGKTFKEWVLSQDEFDLSRICLLGRIPPSELVRMFSLSDLHMYWTVPFTLSWSVMNALSCGTLVAGSDTEPVREMIRHDDNGLLFDFFDIDQQMELVHRVLDHPDDFAGHRLRARETILEQYSYEECLPRIHELYLSVT